MAPKRPPPVEDPPSPISEEEEEEDSSSTEEEEEQQQQSDGEQRQPSPPQPRNNTQNPPHKITETTTQQSESDSESESESESEPDQIVKPITSKPMEETPPKAASAASKKPRSKPATAATPEKTTALKRVNETDREDSKRAKHKEPEPEKPEDSKKQLFQRLWTEDDEIALLRGIIDFTAKKGCDPSKDMNAFYDFIKKSLHFDVSMTQLKDKISRLKKKFENHVKGKKGENKTFSKPHDQKGFDLSKSIWGSDGSIKANGRKNDSGNTSNNNKTGNAKKLEASKSELGMDVGEEDRVEVDMGRGSSVKRVLKFDSSVSVERMEDYVVRMGLNFVHGTEKEKMEEEWRKLHVAELELFLKRNELIREQAKLMLAAFKAEKD
ncbi:PREDICTED: mediator-associated protein 1-like [Populus euphratica]|uniref:Mediator-associated protein 1-like n=1 Tax=Populus euphratica TaxID=75702 RepID=A0AAJ6XTE3_POPEU|nr:PREDICTED: mediator-associated protein 1-like [Populus euphratica]